MYLLYHYISSHHASWYKREVTVTHHGLDYLPGRQEPFNDVTSLLVFHWLFDLFYSLLEMKTTLSSINEWWINGACMQSTNVSACRLHFAHDLLKWCVSELFEVVLLPSAAAKVFCWSEEPRYTERADAAIFQAAEGDACALTLQHTHIRAKADMFISTHTDRGGRWWWWWWSGRLRGQSEVGPQVVWQWDRDKLSAVCVRVMFLRVCVCVCGHAWQWQTPWSVADNQPPVNNVC